jgi:hypothetical protein
VEENMMKDICIEFAQIMENEAEKFAKLEADENATPRRKAEAAVLTTVFQTLAENSIQVVGDCVAEAAVSIEPGDEVFQVWALGYQGNKEANDYEEFLGEFTDAQEAIQHAMRFKDISYVYDADILEEMAEDEYMTVRVEKCVVIEPEDDEDDYVEVEDIIWENDIFMPVEID